MATIDTLQAINVFGTNATLQFEITDDGNPDGCESWSASCGYKPHESDTWIWLDSLMGAGEGILQQNVTGLIPGTQYDVTSRIINAGGTAYGDVETFWVQVQQGLLSVTTLPAKSITTKSVELELLLNDDGDPSTVTYVDTRFVYWADEKRTKTTDWFSTTEGQQSSIKISGLEPDTNYWFYAEAINATGGAAGETLSFKTLPDPNSVPTAFDANEPGSLIIQNFVKALQTDLNNPHNNQGIVTYVEKAGNFATYDINDVFYSNVPGITKTSKIVSLLPMIKADGKVTGYFELSKDARPELFDSNDSNNVALLELSIYSTLFADSDITSENSLKFWIPNDSNSVILKNCFNGKPLTLQQVSADSNESNLNYPLWDIRKVIEKNGRQIPLDKLVARKSNTVYAFYELSTNKELLDINQDNKIDPNDYSELLEDFGKTGTFRSDIAGSKGSGLPDGKVDVNDEVTFIKEYNKRYPENPLQNPYIEISEDFENGSIQQPFISYGDVPWVIDSNTYSGKYSVKSGNISGNQVSILEANINTVSQRISFSRKVWCESEFDILIFKIDNTEAGRWSGQMNWETVDFQITPGTHNFKWIYQKDESISQGQDCVWIDNIEFILY